jgi:hypothetical protein
VRLAPALLQLRSSELVEFVPRAALARGAFDELRAQCEELGGRLAGRVIGCEFAYIITPVWERVFESPCPSNGSLN